MLRLERYEKWRTPIQVDFLAILGHEAWEQYWKLWENVIAELRECQRVAEAIRVQVSTSSSETSIASSCHTPRSPGLTSIMQVLAFAARRQVQGRSRPFGLIGPPFTAGWLERDGPILALFTGLHAAMA